MIRKKYASIFRASFFLSQKRKSRQQQWQERIFSKETSEAIIVGKIAAAAAGFINANGMAYS